MITKEEIAKLVRKAKQDSDFKERLVNSLREVVGKTASANHTADSAAFSAWAKMSNPTKMSEQDVIKYLVSNGVSIKERGEAVMSKVSGTLKEGEIVKVDPHKCLSPENRRVCGILAHDPDTEFFCIIKRVVEPADINSRCTVEVCALSNEDGSVNSKVHQFEAVTPIKVSGIMKAIDGAGKNIDKAEVAIAKEQKSIETETSIISSLDPSDSKDAKKIERSEKKIATSEAKIEKARAKIFENTGKIDVQKVALRMKCLEPNDQLGLYRTGFKSLASFQNFVENPPPPAKDFIIVYNRGGRLPTPALRKQFIDKSNASRTRQTLMSGQFDELVEGGLAGYANTYYEGQITTAGYSKDGNFYFVLKANDRSFTSISPEVGELFYIATTTDLPSDEEWATDLKARLEAEVEED
jgi:hypothetical protein